MGDSMGAILEDMDSKFDLIIELLQSLAPLPQQVREIDERLINVESDVKILKIVVTDHSQILDRMDKRLINIEHDIEDLKMAV